MTIYCYRYKKYLAFGRNILQHLSVTYIQANIATKQRIIGLIFPEKLKFQENAYQTIGELKILSLISQAVKELCGQKKGLKAKIALSPIK